MSAAQTAHVLEADFVEIGEQRQTDRRAGDRRAPRFKLDPLFAATLVNQIAKPETPRLNGYAQVWRGPRPGLVMNVRA